MIASGSKILLLSLKSGYIDILLMIVGDLVDPSYAKKRKRKKNFNICIHFGQCFAYLAFSTTAFTLLSILPFFSILTRNVSPERNGHNKFANGTKPSLHSWSVNYLSFIL